jgi:hypothetical protein
VSRFIWEDNRSQDECRAALVRIEELRVQTLRQRFYRQEIGDRPALGTQRKSFWLLFTLLSFGAFFLPLWWGVAETFASLVLSWWVIYRSGIF